MGSVYEVETLKKGLIHDLGRTELDGVRFHDITQGGMQFKTYGLLIPGIFCFIFLDSS